MREYTPSYYCCGPCIYIYYVRVYMYVFLESRLHQRVIQNPARERERHDLLKIQQERESDELLKIQQEREREGAVERLGWPCLKHGAAEGNIGGRRGKDE